MKSRTSIALLAAIAAYATIPERASAVPGQTIPQFTAWAAQRPALRFISRTRDVMSGLPAFHVVTTKISYFARTDGRRILLENVGVGAGRGEPGTALIRRDGTGEGFAFLRDLYGPAIANDYRTARRVASATYAQNGSTTTFYRGTMYGYSVSGGFVSLETFAELQRDIVRTRRCFANPHDCHE
jgi:hypothetical protein